MGEKLVIANCSGFYGDRFDAAREMVTGGPVDVLTGDYLAELTMAILFRKTLKDPDSGYASSFLKQMEGIMGECLDKGIRVVTNAGGLSPAGLAAELQSIAGKLGLNPKIAYIDGDNLMPRIRELQEQGEAFRHMDRGISLKDAEASPVTANAYLGGWGITAALGEGADIVVGGRIADAALVSGPAAWKFGWRENEWDKLAGAIAAGHIIECGTQATGGNYSFFQEVPSFLKVGFPLAEIYADGSSVITKHPGTGGLVSEGTVKAQLLYEVRGPSYLTPDVTARFDTVQLMQEGADRVRVCNVLGEPPTDTTKVCCNNLFGYRNAVTFVLTGLDVEKKAKVIEETLFEEMGGRESFAHAEVVLQESGIEEPRNNEEAFSYMRVSVMDPDQNRVSRLFPARCIELALSNIPGFSLTDLPGKGAPAIQHWPALVSDAHILQTVSVGDKKIHVKPVSSNEENPEPLAIITDVPENPRGPAVNVPLGRIFGTRSGDKGGNANLGVWARTQTSYAFLYHFLTTEKLKELLPDMEPFEIERHDFPNLMAVNFYIKGVLGEGVAASLRSDPQAKSLGEYLRAKTVAVPESVVEENWLV